MTIGILLNTEAQHSVHRIQTIETLNKLHQVTIIDVSKVRQYSPKHNMFWRLVRKLELKAFIKTASLDTTKFAIVSSQFDLIGYKHIATEETLRTLGLLNLDVIIRYGLNVIEGPILDIPRLGIWSFHHGNPDLFRGSMPAFYEILFSQSRVSILLQRLTTKLDDGGRLFQGSFDIQWCWGKTYSHLLSQESDILTMSLNSSFDKVPKDHLALITSTYRLSKSPSNYEVLSYSIRVIKNFSKLVISNNTPQRWKIGLTTVDNPRFQEASIIHNQNKFSFVADPFLFVENKKYLFFEGMPQNSKKGALYVQFENCVHLLEGISAGHKSFPSVFRYMNRYMLLVESKANNRLEVYVDDGFPIKWTKLEGENAFGRFNDPTFLVQNNSLYVLTSIEDSFFVIRCEIDLKSKKFTLVFDRNTPQLIGYQARNGGHLFTHNDILIRPVMVSDVYNYGKEIEYYKILIENGNLLKHEFVAKFSLNHFKYKAHHVQICDNNLVFDFRP